MKKYYHIFSEVLIAISAIYIVLGALNLTPISGKMILYIFILNLILELIKFIVFKESYNDKKKPLPFKIICLYTSFLVLAIYFDVIYLKIIALVLLLILIIIKIKNEYLVIK
ncbi:MAG: hypothetical protein ACRDA4_04365 [Filifactoraceae bacterium]